MEDHTEETSELLQRIQNVQSRKMIEPTDTCIFLRKRYYVVTGIMLGWIVISMLKTNLSICLVEMTSNKTIIKDNRTYNQEAEFGWTSVEKGLILSSLSWGQLLSPVGGLLVPKIGAVKLFGFGILGMATFNTLTPILITRNGLLYLLLLVRFMEGFSASISTSSEAGIYPYWAPSGERTFLMNVGSFGFSLGIAIAYPIAAHLIAAFGWDKTIYITGAVGISWALLWLVTVRESPEQDKFMMDAEKKYIKQMNEIPNLKAVEFPLKQILTSKPLWAYWNEKFAQSWSFSFFVFCFPLYLKDVFDMNIEEIGWFSSVPFYFEIISVMPGSWLADYLRREKIMSVTAVHKTYIFLAQVGGMVFLAVSAFSRQFWLSFVAVTLSRSIFSISSISYSVLPLDLGYHYGSFILGVAFAMKSIGYILNPIVMGFMITNHSVAEWSRYFIFLCCFNAWALIIFAIYGTGETQPWANPPTIT